VSRDLPGQIRFRGAAPAALLLLFLAGCAQQDAALLVTLSGPFNIPANADKLTLDVYDGAQSIAHREWCAQPAASCPQLPYQSALSATVTLVQSGNAHGRVKLNAALFLTGSTVGLGTASGQFSSGQTVPVPVRLERP
jgi:hypothetical protein